MKAWLAPITLLLLITAHAAACIWDDDTLRAEASGLPGIEEILTGRIERYPSAYYEDRLARSLVEIENDPQAWSGYDNAGVALDRLGRHSEAIEMMQRKSAALDAADEIDDSNLAEHRYRYLANVGTFYVHRWIADGAVRSNLSDLHAAEQLIQAAIDLNPDAHFGREKYQLLAIQWLLDPPAVSDAETLAPFVLSPAVSDQTMRDLHQLRTAWHTDLKSQFPDAVEGLSGLMALGNAWESVDIISTLAIMLDARGDASLAYLARLRVEELVDAGRGSLHPGHDSFTIRRGLSGIGDRSQVHREVEDYFVNARAAAKKWHEARGEFILAQLEQGRHPDTHADFWAGFDPPSAPAVPDGFFGMLPSEVETWAMFLAAGVVGLAVSIVVILVIRRIARRIRTECAEEAAAA